MLGSDLQCAEGPCSNAVAFAAVLVILLHPLRSPELTGGSVRGNRTSLQLRIARWRDQGQRPAVRAGHPEGPAGSRRNTRRRHHRLLEPHVHGAHGRSQRLPVARGTQASDRRQSDDQCLRFRRLRREARASKRDHRVRPHEWRQADSSYQVIGRGCRHFVPVVPWVSSTLWSDATIGLRTEVGRTPARSSALEEIVAFAE